MATTSPLDSASWWLTTSNVLYITGAVFTVLTAAWVVYETRAVALGRHAKFFLLSEIAGATSALICLLGSIGAIHFGNVVSHLKDVQLATYEKSADERIAAANEEAADANKAAGLANKQAGDANKAAADANVKNSQLRIELAQHESTEKKVEADLASKNQQLTTFTQGLAQEQQGIAQQMQVAPSLTDVQVDFIASQLKNFAGKNIAIHVMNDTRSSRLGNQFGVAFQKAGITVNGSGTFLGPDFHGVMVVVHNASPAPHPVLADALINAIRAVGIIPHPTADPSGPKDDEVWLCIGPE